ncbi:MAG: transposase [Proteobacteria bacterium]|nr:transposase [Pseudomonadota bacterium]
MTRRIRRTPQQWQAIIDRQAESGQPARQFCDANGFSYHGFRRWRTKLSVSKQVKQAPLIELSSLVGSPKRQAWEIELSLGDGMVLRLRQA